MSTAHLRRKIKKAIDQLPPARLLGRDCGSRSMRMTNGAAGALFLVLAAIVGLRAGSGSVHASEPATQPATGGDALSFVVKDIDGADVDLRKFRGDVVLIVNVASRCGLTKQYAGLERLYEQYKDRGLVVIGFPANNFGGQEPGSDAEIKQFCTATYGVSFPMMSKISVADDDKHPLYKHLTEPPAAGAFAGEIGWNFTKFLIGRDGQVYARFASKTAPDDENLVAAIERGLAKGK